MGYYSSTTKKVDQVKKNIFEKLIKSVALYKKPLLSKRHNDYKLAIVKLLEMEVHWEGFHRAAQELRAADNDAYYEIMREIFPPES